MRAAAPCIFRAPACIARSRPASRSARPAPPTSATSDGIVLVDQDKCIGCKLCSWACPYGAREFDTDVGVMKKCTLCVDRIYNENLPEADRVPACVAACPTERAAFRRSRRSRFAVSQLVAERGGFDLMPEMGYRADQQISAAARAQRADAAAPTLQPSSRLGRGRLPRLGRSRLSVA